MLKQAGICHWKKSKCFIKLKSACPTAFGRLRFKCFATVVQAWWKHNSSSERVRTLVYSSTPTSKFANIGKLATKISKRPPDRITVEVGVQNVSTDWTINCGWGHPGYAKYLSWDGDIPQNPNARTCRGWLFFVNMNMTVKTSCLSNPLVSLVYPHKTLVQYNKGSICGC